MRLARTGIDSARGYFGIGVEGVSKSANVGALLNDRTLGDQRKYGLMLACAHGTGSRPIVAAAEAEVAGKL